MLVLNIKKFFTRASIESSFLFKAQTKRDYTIAISTISLQMYHNRDGKSIYSRMLRTLFYLFMRFKRFEI